MNSPLPPSDNPIAIELHIDQVLAELSLQEKVAMMSGHGFFEAFAADNKVWGASPYQAGGGCERLGLPTFYFTDGPRGVARGQSTCFPVTMARGATFDTDLEERIGQAMAIEARAQGCNLSGAVCINLLRHPAWGRAQETYGEDMHHLGEMGAALAQGLQAHNVAATVKHFAANSIENARFKVDVQMSERVLREIYLPHFKRVIDAGCLTVMSAYNRLNGEYCGQNRYLLTDILRYEWGFDGVVHSDWVMGVYAPYGAAAGLDIENPEPIHFGDKLLNAVQEGNIEPAVLDVACRRILRVLYRIGTAEDPLPQYGMERVACKAHVSLAYEAALKSAVLLKNDEQLLPVARGKCIAVVGRLAREENIGDGGSSRVRPPHVVSAWDGISEAFGEDRVVFAGDENDVDAAAQTAADADLVVVVVGYTADDEGEYIPGDINLGQDVADAVGSLLDEDSSSENSGDGSVVEGEGVEAQALNGPRGGDRESLGLPTDQIALIRRVAAANSRLLVVIQAGSAVLVRDWVDVVPAVMQVFYPGMEGGRALAALIAGDACPSGRLPFSVAADASHYPFFDKDADAIEYDYWHGYGKLLRDGNCPEYHFGHGLSYTSFEYRALKASTTAEGDLRVEVAVVNRGAIAAEEVAQLYVGAPVSEVERWSRNLKGFKRLHLEPGETGFLRFAVPRDALAYWDEASASWRVTPGIYRIEVGGSSDPSGLLTREVSI